MITCSLCLHYTILYYSYHTSKCLLVTEGMLIGSVANPNEFNYQTPGEIMLQKGVAETLPLSSETRHLASPHLVRRNTFYIRPLLFKILSLVELYKFENNDRALKPPPMVTHPAATHSNNVRMVHRHLG